MPEHISGGLLAAEHSSPGGALTCRPAFALTDHSPGPHLRHGLLILSLVALNACYSGQGKLSKYSIIDDVIQTPTHGLSAAQASVLHNVSCSVESLGPPPADLSSASGEAQRPAMMVFLPVVVLLAIPQQGFHS
jgi:hypothetical protein